MNWISIVDKYPEDDQEVLVYIPRGRDHNDIYVVCHFYQNDEDYKRKFSCFEQFKCLIENEVSHWCELINPN